MLISALIIYTVVMIIIVLTCFKRLNSYQAYLTEREVLIEQREAIYEGNKKEVECIISFLIKELNKQGVNHDK